MKISGLLSGILLFAATGPASANDRPIMPLRIDLPPAMRRPLHSSCIDCGVHHPPPSAPLSKADLEADVKRQEKEEAILEYKARHGGSDAWTELGSFYLFDVSPPRPKAAIPWLTRAAQAGNVEAMELLSKVYGDGGDGVPLSPGAAEYWLTRAAETGDTGDMKDLALTYQYGVQGQGTSPRLAEYWLNRAAEAGDADAQLRLAGLYDLGTFLPHDPEKAARWYIRAAESGNVGAIGQAADFFTRSGDVNRAFDYKVRALKGGVADARFGCYPAPGLSHDRLSYGLALCDYENRNRTPYIPALAEALATGDALPQNLPRAIALLKTGLREGHPEAAFVLAGLYERGDGVTADLPEAARLYGYAARAGRAEARAWLAAHPDVKAPDDDFIDLPNLPEDQQGAIKAAVIQAYAPDIYPVRALDDEVEADVVLDCQWSTANRLEACAIVEENPQGYGFGKASLRAAANAALPQVAARSGGHVLLRLAWRMQ